jgi:hypothetical protein
MKDTVISAAVKRRELKIWLVCFIVANIVNWAAIIKYQTPWYEIFTQIGYVVVSSLLLYGLLLLVRIAYKILRRLSAK